MTFEALKKTSDKYIAATYARFPLGFKSGKGAVLCDFDGKKYIDFGSGIGVSSLGNCDRQWAKAVAKQAKTLSHVSNLYYSKPMAKAAKALCKKTGYKNMFFANSGAEANECAIKTARKYSADKYSPDRCEVITLVNSFHGRTVTTLAATGQDVFHQKFLPLTAGFSYAQANNIEDLKSKITDKTCAVMMEFIQGEGGVIPLEKDFVAQAAKLCAEKDILLIADEVQTGVGRTGTFLASEQYGVKPDITTLAKGLGGGLPIGAALFGEKCMGVLCAGDHGSTFGGNPIVCAGACVVLERVNDELLCNVKKQSEYIFNEVKKINGVKSVTGLGLMIGVEFENLTGREVAEKCFEKGVVFLTAKNKLRMLPPLIINDSQTQFAVGVLKQAVEELLKEKTK